MVRSMGIDTSSNGPWLMAQRLHQRKRFHILVFSFPSVLVIECLLHYIPICLFRTDMEQRIGEKPIYDSLDTVLEDVKLHPDFGLYHAQKACHGSQADCMRLRDTHKEGWALDKYKNIHIIEKAYNMRPDRDWYVVIDADTYIFWSTLILFLGRLDPLRKLFIGSLVWGGK